MLEMIALELASGVYDIRVMSGTIYLGIFELFICAPPTSLNPLYHPIDLINEIFELS